MATTPLPGQVDEISGMSPSGAHDFPAMPGGVPNVQNCNPEVAIALVQEQQKLCEFLTTWTTQQSALWKEHAAKNEQLMSSLLDMHRQTLHNLQHLGKSAGCSEIQTGQADLRNAAMAGSQPEDVAPNVEKQSKEAVNDAGNVEENEDAVSTDVAKELEALEKDEVLLDAWRRSSGLHTVEKWAKNYRKHPGAWGALLMIHGVPEVTGRLRSKVENYAIYSALFLSMSIALMIDPPDTLIAPNANDEWSGEWWAIEIRRRAFFYGLAVGTASHMLSILLGMSFVNALNETARDSDVFRLFSRGKGYLATVKCQYTFRVGCVGDYLAMAVAATAYVHWAEVLIIVSAMLFVAGRILSKTSWLLFANGSIVRYWRVELGGKPDANDPYELNIPLRCFEQRSKTNKNLFVPETGLFNIDSDPYTPGVQNELFSQVRNNEACPSEVKAQVASGNGSADQRGKAVVAPGFF